MTDTLINNAAITRVAASGLGLVPELGDVTETRNIKFKSSIHCLSEWSDISVLQKFIAVISKSSDNVVLNVHYED